MNKAWTAAFWVFWALQLLSTILMLAGLVRGLPGWGGGGSERRRGAPHGVPAAALALALSDGAPRARTAN